MMTDTDRMMTARETAAYLGMTLDNLYVRRHRGDPLPPAHKMGGRLRYRLSDVDEWLDGHREPVAGG